MTKFEGNEDHNTLEVLAVSKPIKCFLNRQIITLLSSLGIPDNVFKNLLEDMLSELDEALNNNQAAINLLVNNCGNHIAYRMLLSGFDVCIEPHLRGLIFAIRNRLLMDLQLKARIIVPKAISLIGIMDETNQLPAGKIFFQWTDLDCNVKRLPVGTRCAVYRNPCLHPGDVRVIELADIPALRHLVNVVVFPAVGSRPHPNEMSGIFLY